MNDDNTYYGQDTDCSTDLPLHDTQVSGVKSLANAAIRMLTTPQGALAMINQDPTYGFDVRQMIDSPATMLSQYPGQIAAALLRDERFTQADVSITGKPPHIVINIAITTSDDTAFTLVMDISSAKYDIITQS